MKKSEDPLAARALDFNCGLRYKVIRRIKDRPRNVKLSRADKKEQLQRRLLQHHKSSNAYIPRKKSEVRANDRKLIHMFEMYIHSNSECVTQLNLFNDSQCT